MKGMYRLYLLALGLCLAACHVQADPAGSNPAQARMSPAAPTTSSTTRSVAALPSGAGSPSSAPSADAADGAARAEASVEPWSLRDSRLKRGMAYSAFRKVVLDHGWQPLPDAKCMANVVGDNYQKLCADHPELGACRACAELPELSACSGDGHCQMQFSHAGSSKTLQAGTYGDIGDWNAPSNRAHLEITGWDFSTTHAD